MIVAKDVDCARPAAGASSRRCWPRISRKRSAASIRSSSGRRSAGRCSTASAGRTWTRCVRSRSGSPRSWRPVADTRRINFDWNEPARQVRVRVDQDEARRLGLSSAALAAVLNAAVTGSTVTQVRDDIYLIDVVARATERGAHIAVDAAHPAGSAAQRAHGRARPVRDLRATSRSIPWSGAATGCRR